MNRPYRHLLAAVLAAYSAFPFFAAAAGHEKPHIVTDEASFKKAAEMAGSIENEPIMDGYRYGEFYPKFQPELNKRLGQCYKSLRTPSTEAVSFVITLDHTGRVEQIAVDKKTNLINCILPHLLKLRFSPPPRMPMMEKIDLQLEEHK